MRLALLEDQFAGVGVSGDEDSPFDLGDCQNLFVLDAGLLVDGHRGDIVSLLFEKAAKRSSVFFTSPFGVLQAGLNVLAGQPG